MLKKPINFEPRYCCGCSCTTRHEIKGLSYSCLRCGQIKHKNVSIRVPRLSAS